MTIVISAKCSDLFYAELLDNNGNQVGNSYDGYVPDFMPGNHYGDYIQLEIDTQTGKIVNWKKPTMAKLQKVFGHF